MGRMRGAEGKREREKRIASEMIGVFCRGRHGTRGGGLCPACAELERYAHARVDRCPFMETKTFCSNCRVHCYRREMRERIREAMRYAGPRMLLRHPVAAVWHMVETRVERRRAGGGGSR